MDLIERLEKWNAGHKSRCAKIDIDDGYGATCWTVELHGNGKYLRVAEASFWEGEPQGEVPNKPGYFYYAFMRDDEKSLCDDWPGLAKVLEYALEKAEEHGL